MTRRHDPLSVEIKPWKPKENPAVELCYILTAGFLVLILTPALLAALIILAVLSTHSIFTWMFP